MTQADPPQLIGPDPIAASLRDDGSLSNDDLISAYESGPQQLRDAVGGMTPEPLRVRPVEGRCSTLEVVCLLTITLSRRQMARILRLLPGGAWCRTAVHSETGLVTSRQLALHPVRHREHQLWVVAEERRATGVPEATRADR